MNSTIQNRGPLRYTLKEENGRVALAPLDNVMPEVAELLLRSLNNFQGLSLEADTLHRMVANIDGEINYYFNETGELFKTENVWVLDLPRYSMSYRKLFEAARKKLLENEFIRRTHTLYGHGRTHDEKALRGTVPAYSKLLENLDICGIPYKVTRVLGNDTRNLNDIYIRLIDETDSYYPRWKLERIQREQQRLMALWEDPGKRTAGVEAAMVGLDTELETLTVEED